MSFYECSTFTPSTVYIAVLYRMLSSHPFKRVLSTKIWKLTKRIKRESNEIRVLAVRGGSGYTGMEETEVEQYLLTWLAVTVEGLNQVLAGHR